MTPTSRQPDQFKNVTNGIDHRRWLSQINPKLDALIRECTGSDAYLLHPESISGLEKYKDDSAVLDRLESIKQENKAPFCRLCGPGVRASSSTPTPSSTYR